ncbi:MAG: rRNA maturation RNase YbeY [Gemmobacter sp.]
MVSLVDTVIEDARWEGFGLDACAEAAGLATLAALGLGPSGFAIVVMGCDDARIAALNADFRGKPQPTNVLSWPSEERGAALPGTAPALPRPGEPGDPAELGDVAIAWETCAAEAEAAGKPMVHHVTHLIVHGILHLLGYDHEHDADATLMEVIEVRALATLGVGNPYL